MMEGEPAGLDFERIDVTKLQASGEMFVSCKSVEEYIDLCIRGQVEARPPYHRLGQPIPARDGRSAVMHPLSRLVRQFEHSHATPTNE